VRGAVTGYGIDDEIIEAYTWLIENFDEGDEIFIFGFISRGVYTARSLSGLICKFGALTLGAPLLGPRIRVRNSRATPALTGAFLRPAFDMTFDFDRRSKSLWMDVAVAPEASPLSGDRSCDTVIIGAGIAGISTAYELATQGQKVIVIDRGRIAGGITARTTAHLAPLCDDLTSEMIKLRGEDISRAFYESHAAAIDRIEEIQKKHGIACDFRRRDGFLFQALGTDPKIIDEEFDAVCKIGAPVHRIVGVAFEHCDAQHALKYPQQATFHPLKYLRGLAEEIVGRQGQFYAGTAVSEIAENEDGTVTVKSDGGLVTARAAVVATNSPISNLFALHTKMAPYRSYAMAFEIRAGGLPDALYCDTLDPYHYVRLQPGDQQKNYVIVGGGDHKSGEADDAGLRFGALDAWARNLIPALGEETHRWSGQVLETIDYAAFIGRNPGNDNIYVHTGDSGQGITHGVVGSLLNSALILGKKARWTDVYEPGRKTPMAVGNFFKENLTAVKNFAEYLAPGELKSFDELKPGTGAIIRQGLSKCAAYRDKSGELLVRSAACTHIGCHLHWNSFETCWDCPCHGSQFAVDGTALNAPAVASLDPMEDKH
jgi:glycine/D-amino acid oxidase-like deaminating enzyme/nitrite reductase/ring-hydroxylating ferredoxin subunit